MEYSENLRNIIYNFLVNKNTIFATLWTYYLPSIGIYFCFTLSRWCQDLNASWQLKEFLSISFWNSVPISDINRLQHTKTLEKNKICGYIICGSSVNVTKSLMENFIFCAVCYNSMLLILGVCYIERLLYSYFI